MKSFKNTIITLSIVSILSAPLFSSMAQADYYHHDHDGFDRGLLAGLLLSTSAIFLTQLAHDPYKQNVYIGADEEAAQFLAGANQPSTILRAAMDLERNFLLANGHPEASAMNDEDLAYMVLQRAEALQNN